MEKRSEEYFKNEIEGTLVAVKEATGEKLVGAQ